MLAPPDGRFGFVQPLQAPAQALYLAFGAGKPVPGRGLAHHVLGCHPAFGAARGALFALPLLWLAGLSEGARVAGVRPELPDLSGARLPALGTGVLGSGAEALLGDER